MDRQSMPELLLTDGENSMIARNLPFQKFVQLPSSRWTATKDRIVNIPINGADIVKTCASLPRTLDEAGIVPIKLKRKMEYKNSHFEQFISINKIFEALKTLKRLGNPHYQFIPDNFETFKEKCLNSDPEHFDLLFPNEEQKMDQDCNGESDTLVTVEEILVPFPNPNHDAEMVTDEIENEEEIEYRTKDPARKWQFDYNASTCFCNDFPELEVREDEPTEDQNNVAISIAPGEGKIPTDILYEDDWDVKSFPGLHPDGQNGLHESRKTRITDQQYFEQRIMNHNEQFANTSAYVFAAFAFVEKREHFFHEGKAKERKFWKYNI